MRVRTFVCEYIVYSGCPVCDDSFCIGGNGVNM